jgi:putative (di)nucleoside polyphosphate hydrolase
MKRPAKYFRAGVGAVIADTRGRVLALERSDYRGAWQLPQGGLEKSETPLEGVYREIEEETGLKPRALKLVARYPELLTYELPPKARSKKTGMGQVQYWFFFMMKKEPKTAPRPPKGEFRAARWVPFDRVLTGVASFRKPVYGKLRTYFDTFFSTRTGTESKVIARKSPLRLATRDQSPTRRRTSAKSGSSVDRPRTLRYSR